MKRLPSTGTVQELHGLRLTLCKFYCIHFTCSNVQRTPYRDSSQGEPTDSGMGPFCFWNVLWNSVLKTAGKFWTFDRDQNTTRPNNLLWQNGEFQTA